MPGHPPIYVGLYIDEFIYFSASEFVKQNLSDELSAEKT